MFPVSTPPRPVQRLALILRDNIDTILCRTLVNMRASADLAALPLSDEERLGNLRTILTQLADHLDAGTPNESNQALMQSARDRGNLRRAQRFPVHLLVENFRVIQQVINNVVYENLLVMNLSYLLLDLNKLADAQLLQLEEAVKAYIEAEQKQR